VGSWSFGRDKIRAAGARCMLAGLGQEIVCGAGQSHYSIGDLRCFTHGNFFLQFVGESNTLLPSMHGQTFNNCTVFISSVI
jgi:hypothetical protein